MITVVAALIEQHGRLLICQRPAHQASFPLQWEFPGGKVKEDETLPQALARELREELGVEVQVGPEVFRTRHRYAEYPDELELVFFSVRADANAVRNLAFEQFLWVEPQSLPNFDFLPADRELVRCLSRGALRLP